MFKRFPDFFKRKRRIFNTFQIEVSTYCSLECQVCPRAVFAGKWIFRNMSVETFQKIGQYFSLAKWIQIEGWGEPLENENLIQMLQLAKQAGCGTGLTTNGVHLTEETSSELLSTGLDLIVVSAGEAVGADHEQPPPGSDFTRILDRIEELIKLRKQRNRHKPIVKLSFLMTRLNIRELPEMITMVAGLGVDEVIAANLGYLPSERCNILRAFYHESPTPAFQDSLDRMHRIGKEMGMSVRTYPLKAEEVLVCEPNPPKNVFFSVDGSVAPCIYLRIPKQGDIPRIFLNKEYRVPQTYFGNINDEDFLEVWNKESYKNFRKVFEDRLRTQFDLAQTLDVISGASFSNLEEKTPKKPPPLSEVCQTCYKAYGI
jgi:MoaA/NifB/PqqE/SkfB family radical SAM enzyme